MQSKAYTTHTITSKHFIPSNEGNYSFESRGLLAYYEAVRRELRFANNALRSLDSSHFSWHADVTQEFILDFLVPFLNTFNHIDNNMIPAFYSSSGENLSIPFAFSEQSTKIQGKLNHLGYLVKQLAHHSLHHHQQQEGAAEEKPQNNIKEVEITLKNELNDLKVLYEELIFQKERFWSPIILKFHEINCLKLEKRIMNYLMSFGDANAGDSSRHMMVSIARAMGLVFSKDPNNFALIFDHEDANEVNPWASVVMQNQFLSHFSFLAKKKSAGWYGRYHQLRSLVYQVYLSNKQPDLVTAAAAKSTSCPVERNAKSGKFVSPIHKAPVPIILLFMLSIVYCLALIPFFAAVSSPLKNLKYLDIEVINFDSSNSLIATELYGMLNLMSDSTDEMPKFKYLNSYQDNGLLEYNADSHDWLKQRVTDGKAWAAVYIAPNASHALNSLFASNCMTTTTPRYAPNAALGFYWDEGRNAPVATPYIGGFIRSTLAGFSGRFAQKYFQQLSSTTIQSCQTNGYSDVLVRPIGFTEKNLTPTSVSYTVANAGLTVGNILVAVFASMFIVLATYNGTAALAEDKGVWGRIILRGGTMALIGFALSICYATAMVGLTKSGSSDNLYSGDVWAQVFAVQWLHFMIWSFGMSCVVEGLGIGIVPFFFVILLIYNIIGGWNIDLADMGYKNFFQIFPFHWAIYILRYSFFKSQGYQRRISGGILIAYWIFFVTLYIYLALKRDKAESIDREVYKTPQKAVTDGSGTNGGVYEIVVSDNETPNHNDV